MKVAVLLTGRMCRFDEIFDRVKQVFDVPGNSVDYFCHTWNDDFVNLKSANKLKDLYDLTVPTDPNRAINSIKPKAVLLSSNLEMLDIINDSVRFVNNPKFSLTFKHILTYINYLAPQLSTYYAMQSLKSYVNETGTKYDVVIKWRYDLLAEKLDFHHEIQPNTLYTKYATEDLMDDRFYYGDYSTMLALLNPNKLEFNNELIYTFYHMSEVGDVVKKNAIDKFNHAWFYNRMLLTSFKAIIPGLSIQQTCQGKRIVIFREYFNKNIGLNDISTFNERLFHHRHGWAEKVLEDSKKEIIYREILVAGCSHVYGHGMSDCLTFSPEETSRPSKFAWPHLLGEWSDSNIVNISRPGNSLGKIAYDILNYPNFKRLSGIIIVLPTSERFLIRGDREPVDTFLATNKYYGGRLNAIGNYLEHLHSVEVSKLNYIAHISYIASLAKTHKIPIWISAGSYAEQEWISKLDNRTFDLNTEKSWYQYYVDLGYPLTPDRHLDHPAHTDFFEKFIKPWVTKNILDVERRILEKNTTVTFKNVQH